MAGAMSGILLSAFTGNLLAQAVPDLTNLAGKVPGTVLLILAIGTLATAFTHGIAKVIQMARPPVERREINKQVSDTLAHQTSLMERIEVAATRQTDLMTGLLKAMDKQSEMMSGVAAAAASTTRSVEEHRAMAVRDREELLREISRIEDAVRDVPSRLGQKLTEDR
jgi:hypothetical protein